MKPFLPVLLLLTLAFAATSCDSDDPDSPQLEGRYAGSETARFVTASGNVDIDFDLVLDIDLPGQSGAFMGDATFDRGAVGSAAPVTAQGVVSGTLTGSTVAFSATASNFGLRQSNGRARGNGLRLDAEGTLRSDGTVVLEASILDFAYGRSETFTLTLEK